MGWDEDVAHMRLRPGMYFGSTGPNGVRNLLLELLSNSLDEVLAGRACTIDVNVGADGSYRVDDDGGGISVEPDEVGVSFMERVLTARHHTPTADGHRPHVHRAPLGVGLAPVGALCSRLAIVTSDGTTGHEVIVERGVVTTRVTQRQETSPRGTSVVMTPDPEIFEGARASLASIEHELQLMVDLAPGLRMSLRVERSYGPEPDLGRLYAETWPWRITENLPMLLAHADGGKAAEIAIALLEGAHHKGPTVRGFCNHVEMSEGGTHVDGVAIGFHRLLGERAPAALRRVQAIVHVHLDDPELSGPTKGRLTSPIAASLVADALERHLPAALAARPDLASRLDDPDS